MNERKKNTTSRGIPVWVIAFLLIVSLTVSLPGCTSFSRYSMRRDELQRSMKRFHLALFVQDTRSLVRYIPSENRPEWVDAFSCFFEKYRVVDYRVQEIKCGPKVQEARVVVWMTTHPIKSMTVRENVWNQEWIYEKSRWFLFPDSASTQAFLGECYVPPEEEEDGSSSP